jgi:enoyl-CoA hydratase/carnithine racemase
MSFNHILFGRAGGIATITLNHPPANTLSISVLQELDAAFGEIEKDQTVRAVLLTGSGERFFSGGADIKELATLDAGEQSVRGQLLLRRIEMLPKPVIAAINGYALGGGLELAMSCHLRYAADTARLGEPEITLGLAPSWGATQRLPRLIGRTRALDLLLSGRAITAQEAERYGLVNRVVPAAELQAAALTFAQRLAAAAPLAVKAILECVDTGLTKGLEKGFDAERENAHWISKSEDAHIGIHAFLTKQKPEFKGR